MPAEGGRSGGAPLDVAIVGLGPVGAAAGALLARRGLAVAAFEREAGVHHMPRAAHFDAEIMRTWQEIGIAGDLAGCTIPISGMDFVDRAGRVILRTDSQANERGIGWSGSTMFYQPELESILRRRAAHHGLAMNLRHEVLAVEPGDRAGALASLRVRDLAEGTERTVEAHWVLGCDGARSMVRAAIGGALEDLGSDQPWLVCDVILRRPVDLPAVALQICDPARPSTYVPMPGRRRRFEFMCLPGESRAEMESSECVAKLLAPWLSPGDADIERAAVYTFHALLASPWSRGRAVLLGDAAHQMPPFLGQGMCAGVRDAANLAWKLDFVQRGRIAADVLDSYESERSPHVRAIIRSAVGAGSIIQTTDPAVAEARDAALAAGEPAPAGVPMAPLEGRLFAPGGDGATGHPLPQPRQDGLLLDDHLGDGFALVAASDPRAMLRAEALRTCAAVGMRLVAAPSLGPWLAEHGATAVVARPDRYVFGVARAAGDLDRIVAALAAALAGS